MALRKEKLLHDAYARYVLSAGRGLGRQQMCQLWAVKVGSNQLQKTALSMRINDGMHCLCRVMKKLGFTG